MSGPETSQTGREEPADPNSQGALHLRSAPVEVAYYHMNGLGGGIVLALVMTAVTTIASSIFFIDDDERVARHLVRRAAERRGEVIESDVPGILFLEIDVVDPSAPM